jgi:hypothetical protein
MSTQPMPTPVKDAPRSHHRFATYLSAIAAALTNNTYFTTSTPTAAAFKAKADEMTDANAKAKGGGTTATATRDKVRSEAEALCDQLVLFVGLNVRSSTGDPAAATDMIRSTKLGIRKHTTFVKAHLTPKYGAHTGEVVLSARSAGAKAAYMFEYSLDGHTWTAMPQSLVSYVTITGLTAAQTYSFRFRVQTQKGGVSDYSQVVTLLVH